MNWLKDFIRPSIRAFAGEQKDVPDNLWQKCPHCDGMLFTKELTANQNVCYHCDHHMPISVTDRLKGLFDDSQYERIELPSVPFDPLKFKDRKKYADRLKESRTKTREKDALAIAHGAIGGQKAVIAAFNFAFMGGSMGSAVGEGIVKAAEEAVKRKAAFIVVPASGGARMQEGMLSLMQMPRTIIAVDMVKEKGLPYIVLLANPTTGGVSASFAMVGDIHIAEPGATIGFAGRRVIEETVRETLPPDFQTAEYLEEHGIVDRVIARKDLNHEIGTILDLLMNPKKSTNLSKEPKGESSPTGRNMANTNKKSSKNSSGSKTKATLTKADAVTKKPANQIDAKRRKVGQK